MNTLAVTSTTSSPAQTSGKSTANAFVNSFVTVTNNLGGCDNDALRKQLEKEIESANKYLAKLKELFATIGKGLDDILDQAGLWFDENSLANKKYSNFTYADKTVQSRIDETEKRLVDLNKQLAELPPCETEKQDEKVRLPVREFAVVPVPSERLDMNFEYSRGRVPLPIANMPRKNAEIAGYMFGTGVAAAGAGFVVPILAGSTVGSSTTIGAGSSFVPKLAFGAGVAALGGLASGEANGEPTDIPFVKRASLENFTTNRDKDGSVYGMIGDRKLVRRDNENSSPQKAEFMFLNTDTFVSEAMSFSVYEDKATGELFLVSNSTDTVLNSTNKTGGALYEIYAPNETKAIKMIDPVTGKTVDVKTGAVPFTTQAKP